VPSASVAANKEFCSAVPNVPGFHKLNTLVKCRE
jgi:hypothetical protein